MTAKARPTSLTQIPLNIELRDDASFVNFHTESNLEAIAAIQALSTGNARGECFVYLWGNEAVGKTHLLQAACREQSRTQAPAAYLSLRDHELAPAMLEGFEALSLVCIDDIDSIAGEAEWEIALFHLYNRLRSSNSRLLVTGKNAPMQSDIQLLDLRSRLAAGLVLQISELSDEGKIIALQLHAHHRGLELSDEVAHYILRRTSRDLRTLISLLEKLDKASLAAARKLTIPFIKNIIQDVYP